MPPFQLPQYDAGRMSAGSRIAALGHYLPTAVLRNTEIADRIGVTPDWITSRTGIEQRHVAAPGESVVDMAVAAAQKALANAGIDRAAVDAVIVATSTAATTIPSAAAQVAARLGLHAPGAFDINAACAGFCTSLGCADALIRSGVARNVLVIGSDKSTDWVDRDDRDTVVLFGDGAGAAVVSASDTAMIGPLVWGSFGEKSQVIVISETTKVLTQDGRAVFRWASNLAPLAAEVCAGSGVDPTQLAAFVPHQANLRIIDALVRGLELDDTVVATDVVDTGNTIAATVPIALSRMAERGQVPSGSPVLLFGFGAGLAYAGQVIVL
jgi:3-oxoacyl-[acyl-carrier-protein] synthase-3